MRFRSQLVCAFLLTSAANASAQNPAPLISLPVVHASEAGPPFDRVAPQAVPASRRPTPGTAPAQPMPTPEGSRIAGKVIGTSLQNVTPLPQPANP